MVDGSSSSPRKAHPMRSASRHRSLASALVGGLTLMAPLGVRATILSARRAREEGEAAAEERLLSDLKPLLVSEDAKEGLASFMERRAAKFTGR